VLAFAAGLLGVAALAFSGSATAGPQPVPDALVKAKGSGLNLHWKVEDGFLDTGGLLKVANKTSDQHTLSLVEQDEVPRTDRQIRHCFDAGHICRVVFKAHQDAGFPPIVDTNNNGFQELFNTDPKEIGDSLFLRNKARLVQVTADPGPVRFMCIIHPWMHDKITVNS
jgi:hypothetical protein